MFHREIHVTDAATVVRPVRKWWRRAIIAIVILILLVVATFRVSRGDRCPICGEDRGATYWQVLFIQIPTGETPAPDCIGGEHRWLENWRTTKMLVSSGGGMHADALLQWTAMSKLQLRPWLQENLPGEERQRVLRALRVATRDEVDEILSNDVARELGAALLDGPDPGWEEQLLAWADRVLTRFESGSQ